MSDEVKTDMADPSILFAILIAARKTGDQVLETFARRELQDKHGVVVKFVEKKERASEEA